MGLAKFLHKTDSARNRRLRLEAPITIIINCQNSTRAMLLGQACSDHLRPCVWKERKTTCQCRPTLHQHWLSFVRFGSTGAAPGSIRNEILEATGFGSFMYTGTAPWPHSMGVAHPLWTPNNCYNLNGPN
jgi:hypothetical protein